MNPWPHFSQDEIDATAEVLKSGKVNYWTGEHCKAFEAEFAAFFGMNHGIALMNGTVALELALYALDIGPGDEVIVPCRTFLASASAVVARGAKPVMADIDLNSQNITVETIKAALTPNTKAIICVHLGGWPCEMDKIMPFAEARGLYVIEDCAQSHGAKIGDRYAGSFGHINAFSFCQDKIMTTGGEGGMVLTNNETWWKKMWAYKDHGKGYDKVFHQPHPPGFRWLHESFGSNWRMTEMQAVIGRKQLEKLPGWIQKRNANAKKLAAAFAEVPFFRLTTPEANISHAYYKYYVFIRPEKLPIGLTRDILIEKINAQQVPCFSGSCSEIYLEQCFVDRGWGLSHRLPNAKNLGETSLMFLVHPTLSEADIDKTISVTLNVCR